jgi:hypothetical protein
MKFTKRRKDINSKLDSNKEYSITEAVTAERKHPKPSSTNLLISMQ